MKRFWKEVAVERTGDEWEVRLDGRAIKTPARAALMLPNEGLASAIAEEWRTVGETVDPRAMPLTGLANAAIDRVAPDPARFADSLARYAEADLTCYRAEGPRALVEQQEQAWDPLLGWARRRYDVDFVTTTGLLHVAQPAATLEHLRHAVCALNAFKLAGLSPMVTAGGSLIAALAILEGGIAPDDAWDAVSIEDRWQREKWGADADAVAAEEGRRRDFLAGAAFLKLLG